MFLLGHLFCNKKNINNSIIDKDKKNFCVRLAASGGLLERCQSKSLIGPRRMSSR